MRLAAAAKKKQGKSITDEPPPPSPTHQIEGENSSFSTGPPPEASLLNPIPIESSTSWLPGEATIQEHAGTAHPKTKKTTTSDSTQPDNPGGNPNGNPGGADPVPPQPAQRYRRPPKRDQRVSDALITDEHLSLIHISEPTRPY